MARAMVLLPLPEGPTIRPTDQSFNPEPTATEETPSAVAVGFGLNDSQSGTSTRNRCDARWAKGTSNIPPTCCTRNESNTGQVTSMSMGGIVSGAETWWFGACRWELREEWES